MEKKKTGIDKRLLVVIALFAGIVISVLSAKTLAYTDSPDFCGSCHIMDNVYDSMMASTHAGLSCSDCHLPQDNLVEKYVFKAKSGLGHVYYNTLGTAQIPQVLQANEGSMNAINGNCKSCHEPTMQNVDHEAKDSCMDCHRESPHGKHFKTPEFYEPPKTGDLIRNKGGFY